MEIHFLRIVRKNMIIRVLKISLKQIFIKECLILVKIGIFAARYDRMKKTGTALQFGSREVFAKHILFDALKMTFC